MKRSELHPLPEYFDRYINKCDDVELLQALQTSIDDVVGLPMDELIALGNSAYAPGKWSISEILQHLLDTERIFMYRALAFSRGEKQALPSFTEDEYAAASQANHRPLLQIVEELKIVHLCFKAMYQSFTPEMLAKQGKSFKGYYSVADIGFTMAGHQKWHFEIIKEKYLPLLNQQ